MNGEESWEDIERLVEARWPMVSKEIRAIMLKRGMINFKLSSDLEFCGNILMQVAIN